MQFSDGRTLPEQGDVESTVGLVGDRYSVERMLGTGGMGVVFAAHDRELDRRVALKVLRDAGGEAFHARLIHEARAIARVAHPNVVQVLDVGVATNGPAYVAMELVDGVSLDTWLLTEDRTPPAIVDAFVAAGRGLAAAHAAGLVHRDFKPGNVMVGDDGRVRVLDFGLARTTDDLAALAPGADVADLVLEETLSNTGAVAGTPRYMSPEQWRGEPADARTDQFSFCVALAAALDGRHPFDDTSPVSCRAAVLAGDVRIAATIPPAIAATLRRGAALRREDRFASMDELLAALTAPPRRRRIAWIAAGALALVAGAVAFALLRGGPPGGGYRCGPNFTTYAVSAPGARGVRCVLFARDRDGTPWLAWYGEGIHRGTPYRQLGEGRLGGAGTAADMVGDVALDDTLQLVASDDGAVPRRIAVGGARDETWIRTGGQHTGYTTVFADLLRECGPRLTRYRVYPKIEASWGFSVSCVTPSGRTWMNDGGWARDSFMVVGTIAYDHGVETPLAGSLCLQDRPCGVRSHGRYGDVPVQRRTLPGVGPILDLSDRFPELWFPWHRRYAVRIHAVRIADDAAPVAAADVERAVRRANELLAAAGIEVFFVADDSGTDVETLERAMLDDAALAALQEQHPYKVLAIFRDDASCTAAPGAALVLPPPAADCPVPWDDRLAHALAAHLGLADLSALTPDETARLEQRILDLRIE